MKRLKEMVQRGADVHGLISKSLYEEILLKLNQIEINPKFYESRANLVKKNLRSIADVYSFWIENPELRVALNTHNRSPKSLEKEAREGILAVNNAWNYVQGVNAQESFAKSLDGPTLSAINGLVNGGSKKDGRFRSRDVTLNFEGYTPPSFGSIFRHVTELISKIKEINEINPLEAAIYAHLGIALIQPWDEANKRSARIVQNKILDDAGLPPAVISPGEGKFYRDLLERTAPAWRDKNVDGQIQFYDYMASKVNNGLDKILADLSIKSSGSSSVRLIIPSDYSDKEIK